MVTVTTEAALAERSSVATREKENAVPDKTTGAMKLAVAWVAPVSVTAGPRVCVHW